MQLSEEPQGKSRAFLQLLIRCILLQILKLNQLVIGLLFFALLVETNMDVICACIRTINFHLYLKMTKVYIFIVFLVKLVSV